MSAIDSDGLRIYFVWQPILATDNADAAVEMAAKEHDPRAHLYWDPANRLGDAFGSILDIPNMPPADDDAEHGIAWDVYLLYPPGVSWDATPPAPSHWEHQLWGLPIENKLDGAALRGHIEALLAEPATMSEST